MGDPHMPKKKNIPIKYTSRDFQTIKEDLVQHAKRYYANEFKDFSDASFGSILLDSVAYVGDVLSFYLDYQANESVMDTAIEYDNVRRHARELGYKYVGNAAAYGTLSFYILVPSNSDGTAPDFSYVPTLERGAYFESSAGATFVLTEDVDFSDAKNAARFDASSGATTYFAIRGYGQIVSGILSAAEADLREESYQKFKRIRVGDANVTEIIKVTDSDGNQYDQVDYLTQEVVFKETTNPTAKSDGVRSILKPFVAARRFIIEQDESGTYMQFGFGSDTDSELTGLVEPSRVALKMHGRRNITASTFDPSELISTNKLGISPSGKILRIIYRANDTISTTSPINTINRIISGKFIYDDQSSLNQNEVNFVNKSIEVTNNEVIATNVLDPTREEIKIRAKSSFSAQARAVTAQDYESLVYQMPAKFGSVARVSIVNDPSSTNRRISMYVISQDQNMKFVATNGVTKNNIKNWLSKYKSLNDVIDVMDAKIVNFGVNFSVVSAPSYNSNFVISNATTKLKEYFEDAMYVGEPIYISSIWNTLNKVEGVVDVKKVDVFNKSTAGYSGNVLDFDDLMSKDGTYIKTPKNVIMEIKYPNLDIKGIIR